MLLLISEASMVCVTLDVTDATTTTVPVMATSILLWAFISSLARLRRVEEASRGDPGRFLLSSMVLMSLARSLAQYCTAVGATRLTPVPWTI